jgi:hypothetical protein
MKAEITKPGAVFIPVGITFTIEKQEDIDKLRTLFDSDFMRIYLDEDIESIVEVFDNAGSHPHRYLEFLDHCIKSAKNK